MTAFTTEDRRYMARAIRLARLGWYTARPNPRVGCVIVRDGEVVGEGHHHRAGEPHAEINALADAGPRAQGATAYVSLEPCNHHGRTGPCSQALIKAGIREVVYGMADPHGIAGGGIEVLTGSGIIVRGPLMEAEAQALNPGFIRRCTSGLPRVTIKLAMSLDGRTAMASGESQWITGPEARRDVQRLRAASDAIVTGIGTVLRDDPRLSVRGHELGLANGEEIASHPPMRVILDSRLQTPSHANVLKGPGKVVVATREIDSEKAALLSAMDAEVLLLPDGEQRLDLRALLDELAQRDCNDVLVEAGAELCGAFVAAGLVDQLVVYMAPKLMGSNARPLLTLPLEAMGESLPLTITDIRAVGSDWRITAKPGEK